MIIYLVISIIALKLQIDYNLGHWIFIFSTGLFLFYLALKTHPERLNTGLNSEGRKNSSQIKLRTPKKVRLLLLLLALTVEVVHTITLDDLFISLSFVVTGIWFLASLPIKQIMNS